MSTYFWADTHFNHTKIIGFANRPYSTVDEMNNHLVARWNSVVKPADNIWVLGDFAFQGVWELPHLFSLLAGHKHLVVGNHDDRNPEVLKLGWERVERLHTFREDGARAELCHYPLETWNQAHHGALMLHGHSHGTLRRKIPHRFDVGCDVYAVPVAFTTLRNLAESQAGYQPQDHHA